MIHDLPKDARGYPIPWFATWKDGKPDFTETDGDKFAQALLEKRCWICGEALRDVGVFVALATCVPFRMAPEPPCHDECARYAVKVCPYLALPKAQRSKIKRSTAHAKAKATDVIMLWTTHRWMLLRDDRIALGEPHRIEYFRGGKAISSVEAKIALA